MQQIKSYILLFIVIFYFSVFADAGCIQKIIPYYCQNTHGVSSRVWDYGADNWSNFKTVMENIKAVNTNDCYLAAQNFLCEVMYHRCVPNTNRYVRLCAADCHAYVNNCPDSAAYGWTHPKCDTLLRCECEKEDPLLPLSPGCEPI